MEEKLRSRYGHRGARNDLGKRLQGCGIMQSDVAEDLGVSPAAVSLTLSGKSKSKRITEHVEGLLAKHEKPEA